jgi:hypothetical protein
MRLRWTHALSSLNRVAAVAQKDWGKPHFSNYSPLCIQGSLRPHRQLWAMRATLGRWGTIHIIAQGDLSE